MGDLQLRPASPIVIGTVLEFPFHRMRVVAVDFERTKAFPDAVAQVVMEVGLKSYSKPGTHIVTPWGPVQVVRHAPQLK